MDDDLIELPPTTSINEADRKQAIDQIEKSSYLSTAAGLVSIGLGLTMGSTTSHPWRWLVAIGVGIACVVAAHKNMEAVRLISTWSENWRRKRDAES